MSEKKILIITIIVTLSIPFLFYLISLDRTFQNRLASLHEINESDSLITHVNKYTYGNGVSIVNEKYILLIHSVGNKVYSHPEIVDSIYKKVGSDSVFLFLINGEIVTTTLLKFDDD